MQFPSPLIPARLVRRYKRFLADAELESGEIVTVHCANPGSMAGLTAPGSQIWLSRSANAKRKLPLSLEMIELPTGLVGINTGHPNRIVAAALAGRAIPELAAYAAIRPEVRYGERSRVDFLLTGPGLPDCYLEVKNVHFSRAAGLAEFPDSVTARGARHLAELAAMAAAGHRAVSLYLVQRADCTHFTLAADFDPAYARAFAEAAAAGVEALSFGCTLDLDGIRLGQPLSIVPPAV